MIGLGGGYVVGLTSVGSGVFFGLTMLIVFPLRSSKVVGTDIFHAAALLWVAGFGHYIAGNVNLHVVAWLLVGSIPGVFLGSLASSRAPGGIIRWVLAFVLLASALKMFGVGTTPMAWALVAAVIGGTAVWSLLRAWNGLRPLPSLRDGAGSARAVRSHQEQGTSVLSP